MNHSKVTSKSSTKQIESGWKIYVDPRYGYSIQYPEGWEVFPTPKKGIGALAQFYSYDRDHYPAREMPIPEGEVKIEIVVLSSLDGLTPSKWMTTQTTASPLRGEFETQEKLVIDNTESKRVIWRDDPYSSTIIMIPYHNVVVQIIIMPANADSTLLLDRMLTSFRWNQE